MRNRGSVFLLWAWVMVVAALCYCSSKSPTAPQLEGPTGGSGIALSVRLSKVLSQAIDRVSVTAEHPSLESVSSELEIDRAEKVARGTLKVPAGEGWVLTANVYVGEILCCTGTSEPVAVTAGGSAEVSIVLRLLGELEAEAVFISWPGETEPLDPTTLVEEDEVEFNVWVRNRAPIELTGWSSVTRLDDAFYSAGKDHSIGADSRTIIYAPWTAEAGDHVVRMTVDSDDLVKESDETNNMGSLSFTVTSLVPVDGSRHDASISPAGDFDWYCFSAEVGTQYILETHEDSGGRAMDTVLGLYYEDRTTQLEEDDDGGVGQLSRMVWSPDVSGRYYVGVRGYDSDTGYYSISITAIPPIALPVDGSRLDASVSPGGDFGWYCFSAESETEYVLETHEDSGGRTMDTTMELYDRDGSTDLLWDDDGGVDRLSRMLWTCPASGWYFVKVCGYSDEAGYYSVSIAAVPAGTVPLPVDGIRRDASIGSEWEENWYCFTAASGRQYVLETHEDSGGRTMDTVMHLYDGEADTLLLSDDDGGVGKLSRIVWTCYTSGLYLVRVRGYLSETGYYSISIL